MTSVEPVTILSASESWDLLASVALGRLVTSVESQPEIFPVNFVVQRRTVLFRTAEGTKLVSAAINNRVLFEADDHDAAEGWSVIVKGTARMLRTNEEIEGGRAGTAAALDCDLEATLRSHSPGLDYRPPFPVRSGTQPGIHIRLIRTLRGAGCHLINRSASAINEGVRRPTSLSTTTVLRRSQRRTNRSPARWRSTRCSRDRA